MTGSTTLNVSAFFESALLSDVGRKRKNNQDFGISKPELGLFIVADGMGGHNGGEVASKLCAESILSTVEATLTQNPLAMSDATLLEHAAQKANQTILDHAKSNPQLEGMGTTLTAIKIKGKQATIAQVGDSRCYLITCDGLWQLTRDHSLVQEKLQAGLIKREQLKTDSYKNVITRSVGYDSALHVDLFTFPIAVGDTFLLCSDGLSGFVEDTEMFEILNKTKENGESLQQATQELVQLANERGGDDNITVVLVRCASNTKNE